MSHVAILHVGAIIQKPDWYTIDHIEEPEAQLETIKTTLRTYEKAYEEAELRFAHIKDCIFNIMCCCFRIIEKRELWRRDIDPAVDRPYESMSRWMRVYFPKEERLRYALTAYRVQKFIPDASVVDLGQMKQCNAVPLASDWVSEECRKDRKLIEATKTARAKDFRAILNKDHGQMLEEMETLEITGPKSGIEKIKDALAEWGETENVNDLFGQLEGLVADWHNGGHREESAA